MMKRHTHRAFAAVAVAMAFCCMSRAASASPLPQGQAIGDLSGRIQLVASTVPPNGDVNPYGTAVVPMTMGDLVQGDVIVSNFNNSQNLQGTGTTIVEISPHGAMHVFAHINADKLPGACPGGVGLTTALAVTTTGWVFVGSLPTTNGMSGTAKAGCILVLDRHGQVVETFSGAPINGPWDMTKFEMGQHVALFVTNVLNGTVAGHGNIVKRGTVVRIDLNVSAGMMPKVMGMTIIGSGFSERTDPGALVIGPTGVGLTPNGNALFVADSLNNRIAAIMNPIMRMGSAGTGQTVTMGGALNDPLGLTVTPGGDILTVNGDDGFLVRTTEQGNQIDKLLLDNSGSPPGSGALFGLALKPDAGGLYFVDDAQNTLMLLRP